MGHEFFARGGTAFDTAHVYGTAIQNTLGEWVNSRGIRDKVVLISKGAHTPYCTPTDLRKQLTEDLDAMQANYADIYFMHRDNPDVPVEEFVDVLNEEVAGGNIIE